MIFVVPPVTAVASWYGDAPGEHGGPIACSTGRLNANALGVAALRWTCGTRLTICTATSCVTASVVDHGPYVPGRDLDLTRRTVTALGLRLSTGLYRVRVTDTGGRVEMAVVRVTRRHARDGERTVFFEDYSGTIVYGRGLALDVREDAR